MASEAKYHLKTGEDDRLRLTITNEIFNDAAITFMKKSGLKSGMKVLDLGCGMGHMAARLAQEVGPQGKVIAIDNSDEQLSVARVVAKEADVSNIEFIQHDAYDLESLNVTCDFIFTRWVLSHLSDVPSVLFELWHKLKPGGVFTCQAANVANTAHFSIPPLPIVAQWKEVTDFIAEIKTADKDVGFLLYPWLKKLGAENLLIEAYQPILKTSREKSYYRLHLLCLKERLIVNGFPVTKLENLIQEFFKLEQDDRVMYGMNRNIFISAQKLGGKHE